MPQVYLSNALNRVHECEDDRQTDHATEESVAIGKIASAKAILRKILP